MPETTSGGALRVSASGRFLQDAQGRPFFWLGDTQWELTRRYTLSEAEEILADRARKGFSVVQVMVTGTGDGRGVNLAGESPWLDHDPARPNERYFQQVDGVVALAARLGLRLVLYLCHNAQRAFVRTDNARAYAAWVARRYRQEPHVMWAFVTDVPIADYLPLTRELAAGVAEGSGGAHLISYHPDPVYPALSSGEIHDEPWLAFHMIQTWAYYEGIWGMVTRDYGRQPAKPVVMAEGAYEEGEEYGFPITTLLVRQQAYWSYLAGGFHSYGHNDSWRVRPTWRTALDAPGARQMTVLRQVFEGLDWWNLVPDQGMLAEQEVPGTTLNVAARSAEGAWALVYLSRPTRVTLRLDHLVGGRGVATWIDPRTGERSAAASFTPQARPVFTTPAGWEDALILVQGEA